MRTQLATDLLRRWRRQIAARRGRASAWRPRDAGALGFLVEGGRRDNLVELDKLLLIVVYDEALDRERPAVRLCGYRASRVEHGVLWGGADNARFHKDLGLMPRRGARGLRVDPRRAELLELALRMDHRIDQAVRFQPSGHNRQFRLPLLWAGFSREAAAALHGDGPELEALCDRFGLTAPSMFQMFQRHQDGLMLFPMDWVSGQLETALGVFAELSGLPRRQVFQLDQFPGQLAGYQGAAAFDFYGSRFRRADLVLDELTPTDQSLCCMSA